MNNTMGFDPLTLQPTGDIQKDYAIWEAEQNEVSGLAQVNPNTTAITYYTNQNPEYKKAQAEAYKPAAGFKPPSNGQMLADMLGGLLIGYGSARLLGGDGKASLAIGLNAAGINHDKDLQEVERYKIIQNSIEQNGMIYNPQSLWSFMKTGNGSAMEQEEREHFNAGQTANNQAWQDQRMNTQQGYQTERQQAQFAQQDKNREDQQAFQQGMQTERLNAKGGLGGYGNGYADNTAPILAQLNPSQRSMVKSALTQASKSVSGNQQRLAAYQNVQHLMDEYNATDDPMRRASIAKEIADDLYRGQHGGNATLPANSEELALPNIGIGGNLENKASLKYNGNYSDDMAKAITQEANSSINDISAGVEQVKNNLVRQFIAQGISPENAEILAQSVMGGAMTPISNSTPDKTLNISDSEMNGYIGQATQQPKGYTVSNGKITLISDGSHWQLA